jgi:hypothetical protein
MSAFGVSSGTGNEAVVTWVEAFRQRLKELGWSDGRNICINLLADGDVQQWQANAGKMVASAPDVIIVVGNPGVALRPCRGNARHTDRIRAGR